MKTLPTCEEVERMLREAEANYERTRNARPKDYSKEPGWADQLESQMSGIRSLKHLKKVVCGDAPKKETQKQEAPPVEDDSPGLEIPTISIPRVAAGGAKSTTNAPTKAPFAAMPRGLVYMVPVVVVLLIAAAVRMAANGSPQVAAESAAPTTTSAPAAATPAAIPTTTSRPASGAPVYRVSGQPAAYSGGPRCADTFVTFAWTIEGLGDTGSYTIRFGDTGEAGPFTIRPGSVNAQTWDPTTHRLTLRQQTGISGGDVAVITKVNNIAITGDGTSKPPAPVACAP